MNSRSIPRSALPEGALGLGLRPELYRQLEQGPSGIDYFEIIAENYLEPEALPRSHLRRVAARWPIVVHGVALNLLGTDPLDLVYLSQLKELVGEFEPAFATDHLCWTAHRGVQHHDLLPVPFRADLVDYAAERAAFVQDYLGLPFGIENVSTYVSFSDNDMTEWDFICEVVKRADCKLLLDVNNIVVSSKNHGFCCDDYLAGVPWERVVEVHVAGHRVLPSGLLHDTHDQAPTHEVWELYRRAWQMGGPFPTLLEWDASLPPLEVMLGELDRARRLRST